MNRIIFPLEYGIQGSEVADLQAALYLLQCSGVIPRDADGAGVAIDWQTQAQLRRHEKSTLAPNAGTLVETTTDRR